MKSLLVVASAVLAQALPVAALADEADTLTLDAVIVTARPDPEDPPVVGQARTRLSRTPGAVSIISAESYQARLALALDDVLRDAPGVFAQRKWGGDIRISIRGSGIGNANHNRGLLLAQDGLPLNEADGYGDSQIADPLLARYTEVYRGGNALRFGGALLGGAINLVTPTGRDAGFEERLRIDGGSFGMLREHLAVARVVGDWDVFVAATNQTGQGWRPQSQQNIQFATLNVGRNFGEAREVRLTIGGANIAQEIPGALTWTQFEADPRQAARGSYAADHGRNMRGLRASLRANWRVDDQLSVEAGAYAIWKDLDHPIFQVIDQQSRNYGLFAKLDWSGELGGKAADGFAGAWLRTGDLDSNFFENVRGARGRPTSASLQNAQAGDLFAEGRWFVREDLAVVAGATWGVAARDYRSFALAGAPGTFDLDASKTYQWLAPRVGLLWQDDRGSQIFANLTKSVEPPNHGSLSPRNTGFAPINAQKAWTAEIGTRGRRGALTWDITAYRAWLEGELLQYTVGPDIPASTFNAGDTVHQGVEAALDWAITPTLRLRQSYTWSDFRFDDDVQYGNNRLPIVPEHVYRAELRYASPQGWFVASSLEWSASDAWVDFANTTRAPSYAVANLNMGWTVNDRVAVFLDLRNLGDTAYVSNVQAQIRATAASAAYWPGDGRAVFAGLTLDF